MNKKEDNKKQYIKELRDDAEKVKKLIGIYQKRRPVVIEFSGAPKSGKTSSINSLMQFLKRNDFRVKVLPESASICPVKDKHSPMFNLWTLCDSVRSLIGELESVRTQYDVIIMDRGIFDAMCWFQWLLKNGKMERSMKETVDRFLTMKELVSYIDVVFVYKVDPKESIKREYASLLTDIPGSIMNEEVLNEYLEAVKEVETHAKAEKHFRMIHSIDTSEADQNDVGKEVTEKTLEVLRELLDEKIGYIKLPDHIRKEFDKEPWMSYQQFRESEEAQNIRFGQRTELEKDDAGSRVQLVPIVVIKEKSSQRILMVKKAEKATREDSQERGHNLAYVGGHVRLEDKCSDHDQFLDICKTALKREVREELGISISLDDAVPDLIYVNDNSRSKLHMAVCFQITMKENSVKIRMESNELLKNRGKGKSGTFVCPDMVLENCDSWSEIILKKCFGLVSKQLKLFSDTE